MSGAKAFEGPAEAPVTALSHLDERGAAHMVDVTGKGVTRRTAVAAGALRTSAHVVALISSAGLPKGEALATLVASRFARGDGGFGGPSEGQPEPHKVPSRAPDRSVDISTRPDQALVYRLCGDRNPLHSDPEFAKRAGFPAPILHGMCTYGITCRGVLQTYADYDAGAFRQHVARFSSPVYPGETVTMDLWKDGNVISFEAKVKSRNVAVIKSGKTVLG